MNTGQGWLKGDPESSWELPGWRVWGCRAIRNQDREASSSFFSLLQELTRFSTYLTYSFPFLYLLTCKAQQKNHSPKFTRPMVSPLINDWSWCQSPWRFEGKKQILAHSSPDCLFKDQMTMLLIAISCWEVGIWGPVCCGTLLAWVLDCWEGVHLRSAATSGQGHRLSTCLLL